MTDTAIPMLYRRHLLAGMVAFATASTHAHAADAQPRPWTPGRPTPALTLPSLDGARWSLSQARGKVVALNFWGSWCEPCVAELPALERLAQRHVAQGLAVLAVNFRESEAAISNFLQRVPSALTILRDADGTVAREWGVQVFPTTVVVGRDGRAAFLVVGEFDWSGPQAARWLAPLLSRPA